MVILIAGASHTGKTLLAQRMLEKYKYRLALTDEYNDQHFSEIKGHSLDIEKRLEDSCTVATLKNDNKNYIDGFKKVGEKVCMINSDYEQVIQSNQQVLLNHRVIRPWSVFTPASYVCLGYHNSSISIVALTCIFHRVSDAHPALALPFFKGVFLNFSPACWHPS